MADTLVFHSAFDPSEPWRDALAEELPWLAFRRSDEQGDDASVRYALVWNPPAGFFARFPNLELVINLGAGVDALVARGDLPSVPIIRISDPDMSRMMASFVLFAVLRHARDIPLLEQAQRRRTWQFLPPRVAEDITVGILGLGELGGAAAVELLRHGFRVQGWSRTPRTQPGVRCVSGDAALDDFLATSEILVVMLPLTPQTRQLLDASRLARLPFGAKFINVARGAIVDEDALIAALRSGHIAQATLDVFAVEPLPEDSPLWAMENVLITPHLASVAIPRSAAAQVAANIRWARAGEPLQNQVDPARGY